MLLSLLIGFFLLRRQELCSYHILLLKGIL